MDLFDVPPVSLDETMAQLNPPLRLLDQIAWDPPSEPCQTSEDAAEAIKPHVRHLRAAVLRRLRYVPQTDDELEQSTGLSHQCCSPRRRELVQAGLVEWSGETRPTRSGRSAKVWSITTRGLRALDEVAA